MAQAAPAIGDPVIFESSVAALLKLGQRLAPAGKERLKRAGLDVGAKLLPAYPARTWAGFVEVLGQELFPQLAREAAHREVGLAAVESFADTLQGKAVFAFLRMLGPVRALGRLTWTLKTGASFLETRSSEVRPGEFELWMSDVTGVPGFYQGLLEAGTRNSGAIEPKVEILRREAPACVYRLFLRNS